MTKQMAGLGGAGKLKAMRELARSDPGMMPGARMPSFGGRVSTKTVSPKTKFKPRKGRRK